MTVGELEQMSDFEQIASVVALCVLALMWISFFFRR
ncbi:MAG: hypothetical protein Q27BPR15_09495 [Rhodobacter sp. CACIA14H1]|nr:MAG: hypothetical protein Q27BPR15_09495 [Rhodobacter sp. CACIA14H1]